MSNQINVAVKCTRRHCLSTVLVKLDDDVELSTSLKDQLPQLGWSYMTYLRPVCGEEHKTKKQLEAEQAEIMTCSTCSESFTDVDEFDIHLSTHRADEPESEDETEDDGDAEESEAEILVWAATSSGKCEVDEHDAPARARWTDQHGRRYCSEHKNAATD